MNKLQSTYFSHENDSSLLKVNEIINSLYAMRQHQIQPELKKNVKIIAELLQHDFIGQIKSLSLSKLLLCELILFIAQEAAVEKPRLTLMENALEENKKMSLTATLRNTLTSIHQILDEIIWKTTNAKQQNGFQKYFSYNNQKLFENYEQFQLLIDEFDSLLQGGDPKLQYRVKRQKVKSQKMNSFRIKQELYELKMKQNKKNQQFEAHEALIEQLEQIIQKKQKRIAELTHECNEQELEHKQTEDLIEELEIRNYQLKEEVKRINQRLSKKDEKQIELQTKLEALQSHLHQQGKRKNSFISDKNIKTKLTIDDFEERKDLRDLSNELSSKTYQDLSSTQKKKNNHSQIDSYTRMLMLQALSIEAMI